MSFVYILHHGHEPILKIGLSVNPFGRARSLPEPIDYARSLQMAVDPQWVHRIEKTLHFAAREFAIEPDVRGDGATEWFREEALEVVLAFVERNAEVFGHARFAPLTIPDFRKPKPAVAAARPDFLKQMVLNAHTYNDRALAALSTAIKRMSEVGRVYGCAGDGLYSDSTLIACVTDHSIVDDLYAQVCELHRESVVLIGELSLRKKGVGQPVMIGRLIGESELNKLHSWVRFRVRLFPRWASHPVMRAVLEIVKTVDMIELWGVNVAQL